MATDRRVIRGSAATVDTSLTQGKILEGNLVRKEDTGELFYAEGAARGPATRLDPVFTPRSLRRRLGVNALDYLKGDGVSDETAAFNFMVSEVPDGSRIWLPHGTYNFSRTPGQQYALRLLRRKGLTFRGEEDTVLRFAGDISDAVGQQFGAVMSFGVDHILWKNVTFEVTVTGVPTGRRNAYTLYSANDGDMPSQYMITQGCTFRMTHPQGSSENYQALYTVYSYGYNAARPGERTNTWLISENDTWESCEGRLIQPWLTEHVRVSNARMLNSGPITHATCLRFVGGPRDVEVDRAYVEMAAGAGATIGLAAGSGQDLSANAASFIPTPAENVRVRGLKIVSRGGSVSNAHIGVYLNYVKGFTCEHFEVTQDISTDYAGYGIRANNLSSFGPPSDVRFSHGKVAGWTGYGLYVPDATHAADLRLSHVEFGYPSSPGLAITARDIYDPGGVVSQQDCNPSTQATAAVSRLIGTGSPEGARTASIGSTYTDTATGQTWTKRGSPTLSTGWGRETAQYNLVPVGGDTLAVAWDARQLLRLNADAAVTLSAAAISPGLYAGQQVVLLGASETAPVTVPNGGNVRLNRACVLGQYDTLTLVWDAAFVRWVETGRFQYFGGSDNVAVTAGMTLPSPNVDQDRVYNLQAAAAVTLSAATPVAAGGFTGQRLTLVGLSDANTVTVQGGGNVRLGAASRVLGASDTLSLLWNANGARWQELSYSNNS